MSIYECSDCKMILPNELKKGRGFKRYCSVCINKKENKIVNVNKTYVYNWRTTFTNTDYIPRWITRRND